MGPPTILPFNPHRSSLPLVAKSILIYELILIIRIWFYSYHSYALVYWYRVLRKKVRSNRFRLFPFRSPLLREFCEAKFLAEQTRKRAIALQSLPRNHAENFRVSSAFCSASVLRKKLLRNFVFFSSAYWNVLLQRVRCPVIRRD